ncbi:hypothetical protein NDU88_004739 [Pleurodeles waltl]|uniref:Uncharacterized protein n=1 Tax=Pleurodeles waltl TaxID=8319 RepID=A0AAV7T8G3_PLEWA|nr:hypothetical protein NDU88_004739 [Pleurodeles waltl]
MHKVFSLYQQQKNLIPDVLSRVHYFHIKEVMQDPRRQELLVFRENSLSMYRDVSTHTLARRREFQDVRLHLPEHKIVYRWCFPLHLDFTEQDKRAAERTPAEAGEALGLSPPRGGEDSPGPAMPSLVDRRGGGDNQTRRAKRKKPASNAGQMPRFSIELPLMMTHLLDRCAHQGTGLDQDRRRWSTHETLLYAVDSCYMVLN